MGPLKFALIGFFLRVGKYHAILSVNPPWGVKLMQADQIGQANWCWSTFKFCLQLETCFAQQTSPF